MLPGEITVRQAAARLGVVCHVLYYWIHIGRLTARKGPDGRWCIPWDQHVAADCRGWLAHPEQFIPRGLGSRPLPIAGTADGAEEWSIQQVAARLGVLPAAVAHQIRAGHLAARHTARGRVAVPWDAVVETPLRGQLARPKPPGHRVAEL